MTDYDSTADTLKHSQRVGELMSEAIKELVDRSTRHDRSKTEAPELDVFNEFTPKLKHSTYGSDEYKGFLEAMGEGLVHHYAHNRHHPEHFEDGVDGMTLVDLIEMLADWRAATERHADGSMARSLVQQKERFGITDQLQSILVNTAIHFDWVRDKELADPEEDERGGRTGATMSGKRTRALRDLGWEKCEVCRGSGGWYEQTHATLAGEYWEDCSNNCLSGLVPPASQVEAVRDLFISWRVKDMSKNEVARAALIASMEGVGE